MLSAPEPAPTPAGLLVEVVEDEVLEVVLLDVDVDVVDCVLAVVVGARSVVRPPPALLKIPPPPPPPPPVAIGVVVVGLLPPRAVPIPAQQFSPGGQKVPSVQHVHDSVIQLSSKTHDTEPGAHPAIVPSQVSPVGQQPTESQ